MLSSSQGIMSYEAELRAFPHFLMRYLRKTSVNFPTPNWVSHGTAEHEIRRRSRGAISPGCVRPFSGFLSQKLRIYTKTSLLGLDSHVIPEARELTVSGNCTVSHHTENRQLASNFMRFARFGTRNHAPQAYLHSAKTHVSSEAFSGFIRINRAESEQPQEISHGYVKARLACPRKP